MPKCVVTTSHFDWENDSPAHDGICTTACSMSLHVKGRFTFLNPEIPPELRGTYAGLAHPTAIAYLKKLGITAVELMPVHEFVDDKRLVEAGLRNYRGYNSINFFSSHVALLRLRQRG